MTAVEVLGSVDELADGTAGSVDAATGAAIGPYRKSRFKDLRLTPRLCLVRLLRRTSDREGAALTTSSIDKVLQGT